MQITGDKVTPKVQVMWAKVNTPDTKYVSTGVFYIKAIFEPETNVEHEKFINEFKAMQEDAFSEIAKKDPKKKRWSIHERFVEELDEDGEPTGRLVATFKQNAVLKSKRTGKEWRIEKIPCFDAKRQELTDVEIGNYSTCRIKFSTRTTESANNKEVITTMDLGAVQVIDLVQSGNSNASGFEDEEGFDAGNQTFPASTDYEADEEVDEDDGDF